MISRFLTAALIVFISGALFAQQFNINEVADRNLNIALQAYGNVDIAQLTELKLSGNRISDISPLSNLTKLTKLDLYNNSLSDIEALGSLINLKTLIIGKNQITNIGVFSNLVNLNVIYIDRNKISDFSPLKGLTGLQELNISGIFLDMPSFEEWQFQKALILTESSGNTVRIKEADKKKWGLRNGRIVKAWKE